MPKSLLNSYDDEEFIRIVQQAQSYKECLILLGYHSSSGASVNQLKKRIEQLNIDISHFHTQIERRVLTSEIDFNSHSTYK